MVHFLKHTRLDQGSIGMVKDLLFHFDPQQSHVPLVQSPKLVDQVLRDSPVNRLVHYHRLVQDALLHKLVQAQLVLQV